MSWRLLIEGRSGERGAFVSYLYPGEDLGDAIALSLRAAPSDTGLDACRVSSAAPDEEPTAEVEFLESSIAPLRRSAAIHVWDRRDEDADFAFPVGVVPGEDEGPFDSDEIVEGYATGRAEDHVWLEAVVDRRSLSRILDALRRRLPLLDGLEVRILGHWDDCGTTQVHVGDDRYIGDTVWDFIHEERADLLENGHVEFGVYWRDRKSTLRITEHKLLLFTSGQAGERGRVERVLRDEGWGRCEPLLTVARRCHHFHYRLPATRSRATLTSALSARGFALFDSWPWPEEA